jgi:hypothetical protein
VGKERLALKADTLTAIYESLSRENVGASTSPWSVTGINLPLSPQRLFNFTVGLCLVLRRLVAGFLLRRPWFEPRSGHVGFVMDKVLLEKNFSEYFDFPCQFSFHLLLRTYHISAATGTTDQLVADVPSEFSLTPSQESKKKIRLICA